MNWCTVNHPSGATSIDFDKEMNLKFGQTLSGEEVSYRSSSTASCGKEISTASTGDVSPPKNTSSNNRRRSVYTRLTDLIIFKYVDMFGPRWRFIARHMGGPSRGWTDDMVRNRFRRLDPSAQTQRAPCTPTKHASHCSWSEEEDNTLLMKLNQNQDRVSWIELHKDTFKQRRSKNAIRNRAYRLGATQMTPPPSPPPKPAGARRFPTSMRLSSITEICT